MWLLYRVHFSLQGAPKPGADAISSGASKR